MSSQPTSQNQKSSSDRNYASSITSVDSSNTRTSNDKVPLISSSSKRLSPPKESRSPLEKAKKFLSSVGESPTKEADEEARAKGEMTIQQKAFAGMDFPPRR